MDNNKKKKKEKFEPIKSICAIVIILVCFLTIGYSAYSANLTIDDMYASITIESDIRVTGVSVNNYALGVTPYWEKYNVNNITSRVDLPADDSTVTYQVSITNIGNVEMGILDITGLPNNLTYTITGYNLKDKLCDTNDSTKCTLGSVTTFLITVSYVENDRDSENTDYQLELDFHFEKVYTITYDDFANTAGLPTIILENETKTITFNNNTTIPSVVGVNGATSDYDSPTLTLSNARRNVTITKKYLITYVLNGGTQTDGQLTSITPSQTYKLLDPTKDKSHFTGWYSDESLEGNIIITLSNVQNDIVLYASWDKFDYYLDDAILDGTSNSVINTGIYLYSAENVNRNFRITFTIEDYDSSYETASNINQQTIFNCKNEYVSSVWPGIMLRLSKSSSSPTYEFGMRDSHLTTSYKYFNLAKNINVSVIRENGKIYLNWNAKRHTLIYTYKDVIDTFDVPLTFGGIINSSGNYDRVFKGKISNISVEFYEGEIVEELDYQSSYVETREDNLYKLDGIICFDGSNYIDTGINLFSARNGEKDFELSFNLEDIGSSNGNQATLVNAKNEADSSYPGFAYRYESNMKMTARWPGQANVSNNDSSGVLPRKITISRRNGIIYYKIGSAAENVLIEAPMSALSKNFNVNTTFGASINSSGNPFRYFNGCISDASVEVFDS